MKKAYLAALTVLFAASPLLAQNRLVCNPLTASETQNRKKTSPVYPFLKSIDSNNGSGVTRIGIDLKSFPSTSSRLDSATLVNGKKSFRATDVDGVEVNRYFQWEENGVVYIELDFPRQKKIDKDSKVILHTVHGDYILSLKKSSRNKK